MAKQLIVANFFSASEMAEAMKVSKTICSDHVKEGKVTPTGKNADGVLYSLKNIPLAYADKPTLNNVVFSSALWNRLLNDKDEMTRMKVFKSFFGEADHCDRESIHFPDVSHRVTDFHIDSDKVVRGDVDILDTPMGNVLYSILKAGSWIGFSSRGWGDLTPFSISSAKENYDLGDIDPNLVQVVEADTYISTSFDAVACPAVPVAMASITSNKELKDEVISALESCKSPMYKEMLERLRSEATKVEDDKETKKEIKDAVKDAVELAKNPPVSPELKDVKPEGDVEKGQAKQQGEGKEEIEPVISDIRSAYLRSRDAHTAYYELLAFDVPPASARKMLAEWKTITSWKDQLQKVYDSLEEFESYCETYGLLEKLGFATPEEAWAANPLIEGSTNPADFRVVSMAKVNSAEDLSVETNTAMEPAPAGDLRPMFDESVLAQLETEGMVADGKIAIDSMTFVLEDGYLIQRDVADGESVFQNGGLAVDLFSESGSDISRAVEFIKTAPSGGAVGASPDVDVVETESFEEAPDEGGAEVVEEEASVQEEPGDADGGDVAVAASKKVLAHVKRLQSKIRRRPVMSEEDAQDEAALVAKAQAKGKVAVMAQGDWLILEPEVAYQLASTQNGIYIPEVEWPLVFSKKALMSEYNGWANYETWDVSLWLQNDEGFYQMSLDYDTWPPLRQALLDSGSTATPDDVAWDDPAVDESQINAMLKEQRSEVNDNEFHNLSFESGKKVNSDTVKRDGKWANVGKDGKKDSGTFDSKKKADDQRKAMYANGYQGSAKVNSMGMGAFEKHANDDETYNIVRKFRRGQIDRARAESFLLKKGISRQEAAELLGSAKEPLRSEVDYSVDQSAITFTIADPSDLEGIASMDDLMDATGLAGNGYFYIDDVGMAELVDDQGNPTSVGLTSAPVIMHDADVEGDGKFMIYDTTDVYFYEDYQITDPIDVLREKGRVTFKAGTDGSEGLESKKKF